MTKATAVMNKHKPERKVQVSAGSSTKKKEKNEQKKCLSLSPSPAPDPGSPQGLEQEFQSRPSLLTLRLHQVQKC